MVGVVSAFWVRGGLAMSAFGMTLQDLHGQPASRWLSGRRALLAWLPILILGTLAELSHNFLGTVIVAALCCRFLVRHIIAICHRRAAFKIGRLELGSTQTTF